MQAPISPQKPVPRDSSRDSNRLNIFLYTMLVISSVILMLPLISLILTSFKTFGEAVGPFKWIPAQFNLENYQAVFKLRDFNYWNYLGNTMLIFVLKTAGTLISCSLAAYGYARFNYKYKGIFFGLLLTVIMLPGELLTIPMYEVYLKLGWYDTYYPLYLATYFGTDVFMIFLFRQFFMSIPKELFEAAQIDGASEFQMYRRIMLPLSRPAIITCILLYFTGTYNDIYTPLLYISSPQKYTMAQGLRAIESIFNNGSRDYIVPWNLVSAATVLSLIPVLLVFAIAQRQFMEGVSRSGIKG
jgi:multiple sugar transport system permease protein